MQSAAWIKKFIFAISNGGNIGFIPPCEDGEVGSGSQCTTCTLYKSVSPLQPDCAGGRVSAGWIRGFAAATLWSLLEVVRHSEFRLSGKSQIC